jgi:hypothetical protein
MDDEHHLKIVEMIEHLVHIAPEITPLESETWVLVVDTVILVSCTAAF